MDIIQNAFVTDVETLTVGDRRQEQSKKAENKPGKKNESVKDKKAEGKGEVISKKQKIQEVATG